MDEKLKEMLSGLAVKGLQGAEEAVKQVQLNAPGLIEEFLRWKSAWALICFGFGFFILFLGIILWMLSFKKKWWSTTFESSDGSSEALLFVMLMAPCTVGLANIFLNLEWLQIWLAPRVYLIEYAMNLVKK